MSKQKLSKSKSEINPGLKLRVLAVTQDNYLKKQSVSQKRNENNQINRVVEQY